MSTFFINNTANTSERFDPSVFMAYTDNYDPLTSEFLRLLPTLPTVGRYTVTNELARPDLVSYRIYKDTQYWWILMMYNKIFRVEDLVLGTILNFPNISSLESLYFSLTSSQSAAK